MKMGYCNYMVIICILNRILFKLYLIYFLWFIRLIKDLFFLCLVLDIFVEVFGWLWILG